MSFLSIISEHIDVFVRFWPEFKYPVLVAARLLHSHRFGKSHCRFLTVLRSATSKSVAATAHADFSILCVCVCGGGAYINTKSHNELLWRIQKFPVASPNSPWLTLATTLGWYQYFNCSLLLKRKAAFSERLQTFDHILQNRLHGPYDTVVAILLRLLDVLCSNIDLNSFQFYTVFLSFSAIVTSIRPLALPSALSQFVVNYSAPTVTA